MYVDTPLKYAPGDDDLYSLFANHIAYLSIQCAVKNSIGIITYITYISSLFVCALGTLWVTKIIFCHQLCIKLELF